MNILPLFIIVPALLMTIGCSFKKDQPVLQTKETQRSLFDAIKESSYEEIENSINSLGPGQINVLEKDGKTLLEAALERGNFNIVKLLLSEGASPLRKGSSSDVKPYEMIPSYPHDVGYQVGKWVTDFYIKVVLESTSTTAAWNHFQASGGNCTDLLNIHSFFGFTMGLSSPTVQTIAENQCVNQLDLKQYDNWLLGELVLQTRDNRPYNSFISYLLKLKSVEHVEFKLKTNEGTLIIKPRDFVHLAILNPSLSNNHDSLKKLWDVLPKTNSFISFNAASEVPFLNKYYSMDGISNDEAADLNAKIMFATSSFGPMSFTHCLTFCHKVIPSEL